MAGCCWARWSDGGRPARRRSQGTKDRPTWAKGRHAQSVGSGLSVVPVLLTTSGSLRQFTAQCTTDDGVGRLLLFE